MPSPTSSPLSDEQVREYEQMLSAVSPTPWMVDNSHPRYARKVYADDVLGSMVADCHGTHTSLSLEQEDANAAFIAASPTIVAALLADRSRLSARVEELERELDEQADREAMRRLIDDLSR